MAEDKKKEIDVTVTEEYLKEKLYKITKSIFNYCETDKRMLRRRNSGVHNQC